MQPCVHMMQQSFHITFWLIKHHNTKFGCKWFCCSDDTVMTDRWIKWFHYTHNHQPSSLQGVYKIGVGDKINPEKKKHFVLTCTNNLVCTHTHHLLRKNYNTVFNRCMFSYEDVKLWRWYIMWTSEFVIRSILKGNTNSITQKCKKRKKRKKKKELCDTEVIRWGAPV